MPWRRRLEPFVRPLYRTWWRVSRGMTLGVRAVVLNEAGEALMVEHTYSRGWHLPGGGVERGESAEEALARELVEEAGVAMIGAPTLLGVYTRYSSFRGDHVLAFRIDAWTPGQPTAGWTIRPSAPPSSPAASSPTRRNPCPAASSARRPPFGAKRDH
jgi:ADP-ribose pyrophosphatase YjhB (NUDIX family)